MRTIELTAEETELYKCVQNINKSNDFDENQESLEASRTLMKKLLEREAIPVRRKQFFTDSEFQTAKTKMPRIEVFVSNGTKGEAIFRHPHFIKYLDFFINGASVPEKLEHAAEKFIENNVYQDDAFEKLLDYVKSNKLIPKNKSEKNRFADEIFKLTVDLEFELDYCFQIRKAIMQSR